MARGKKSKFSILRINREISSALKDIGKPRPPKARKTAKKGKPEKKPPKTKPVKKPPLKAKAVPAKAPPRKKLIPKIPKKIAKAIPRPPSKIQIKPGPLAPEKVLSSPPKKARPGLKIIGKSKAILPKSPVMVPKESLPEEGGMNIETSPDRLYKMIQARGKIPLQQAAREFSLEEKKVEEWARILEEHNLIRMHYPAFGKATLYSLDFEGKRKKKVKAPPQKTEY